MDNIEITKKINAGVHKARILFKTSIGMERIGMDYIVLYYSDNKIKYELLLNIGNLL